MPSFLCLGSSLPAILVLEVGNNHPDAIVFDVKEEADG